MSASKHPSTLVYATSRVFSHWLFALAISQLARPQTAAAAPSGEPMKGQRAEQLRAIDKESYRVLLRFYSSLNMYSGTNGASHRKRGTSLLDLLRGLIPGGNTGSTGLGGQSNQNSGQTTHSQTSTTKKTTSTTQTTPAQAPTTQHPATTTAMGNSQSPTTQAPSTATPTSLQSSTQLTQESDAVSTGGTPSGAQQQSQNSLPPQNGGNSLQPIGPPGMVTTTVDGGQPVVNVNTAGPSQGLVIGLVVCIIILSLLGCFVGVWLFRRARKQRREREQTSTQDDTAPWIWKRDEKGVMVEKSGGMERRTPSPDPSLDSRASFTASTVSQIRARTPGGTPAIPVPYNPSEISDDMSMHFTMLPQDNTIGVPVPYPLALHVPSRVAQAMLERDERWQQYERLRQGKGDDLSETSTIPRPLSRMPQRRSTLRSVTSGRPTSSEVYGGLESRRNSRRSTGDNEGYPASELDRSRSEIAAIDHREGQSARSSVVSDFPTPPPTSQSHRRDSYTSNPRMRKLPPLPSSRVSSDGFPFPVAAESPLEAENPFRTDPDVNISGMRNITEEPSTLEDLDEDAEDQAASVVESITGVARSASTARTPRRLGRTPSNPFGRRAPSSQNPFNDGPSRFSAADSIGESVDTHQIHGLVYGFPTPPDPSQRP